MNMDVANQSDITRPWHEVGGAICEINGQPQFSTTRPQIPGVEQIQSNLFNPHGYGARSLSDAIPVDALAH